MNNEAQKFKKGSLTLNKFCEDKTVIIKSGYLCKRSKYLKIWKKRFIILTNKNIFSFTSDEKTADCTMNLEMSNCKRVENSDKNFSSKSNTFCIVCTDRNYYFQSHSESDRNEWITLIKKAVSNPGVIDEQAELDYANNPDRTISFIVPFHDDK